MPIADIQIDGDVSGPLSYGCHAADNDVDGVSLAQNGQQTPGVEHLIFSWHVEELEPKRALPGAVPSALLVSSAAFPATGKDQFHSVLPEPGLPRRKTSFSSAMLLIPL